MKKKKTKTVNRFDYFQKIFFSRLGSVFLCIGIIYFVVFLQAEVDPHIAVFDKNSPKEKPMRVIIPRLNINVSVVEAKVVEESWEVSEVFASHGVGSAYPGQKGNMVIFAHARPELFLPLENISQGDYVYVLTDKKLYSYKVSQITEVAPQQVEVIEPTADERVTLFTCSGFSDGKRLIVSAKRENILASK